LFGEPLDNVSHESSNPSNSDQQPRVSEHFLSVCKLLEEMKNKNFELDASFYDDIAKSLAAGRQAGILINISTALEKRGVTPSIYFYNQLLSTLPKKGFLQRATTLYEKLVTRGLAVYSTHMIRINQLFQSGLFEQGLNMHKEIVKKSQATRVSYNILINGYLRVNRLGDALKAYNEMKAQGFNPDRVTISQFLSHFYFSSDLNGASMILGDLKLAEYPKTASDYGLLIRLNARYDPSQAILLLKEATGKGYVDQRLVSDIIRVITDKRVVNEWKDAIHEAFLEAVGISHPNTDGPLCKIIPERTVSIPGGQPYRHMVKEIAGVVEEKGWVPSYFLLEYVVRRMVVQQDTTHLAEFEDYIRNNKLAPSWNLKNLLIQAHLVAGDRQSAMDMLNNLIRSKSALTQSTIKTMDQHGLSVPPGIRTLNRDRDTGDSPSLSARAAVN
jgi:pentatricopeptide repeat protein